MRITVKQLNEMITRAILQEVDARRIPRTWLGTYAFVLAYNQGLKEGLFPRHQAIEIEFVNNRTTKWANGKLTVNILGYAPDKTFFTTGPGHDLLHGLTQNSQPHFGTFRSNEPDVSTNNKAEYRYRPIKRAFQRIKQLYKIDLEAKFGKAFPNKDLEKFRETVLDFLRKGMREKENEGGDARNWSRAFYEFQDMTIPSNYYSNNHMRNKGGKNNPTHAIEEEIGNVVSDGLAALLAKSMPIDNEVVSSILKQVDSWEDAFEFTFYKDPSNDATALRWKQHMHNVLPRFAELYNQKLAMLEKTKLGSLPRYEM